MAFYGDRDFLCLLGWLEGEDLARGCGADLLGPFLAFNRVVALMLGGIDVERVCLSNERRSLLGSVRRGRGASGGCDWGIPFD